MRYLVLGVCSVALIGCSSVPGMPPDYALPVSDIVRHSFCELRVALQYLKKKKPAFEAEKWVISVTLTPKIDSDLAARAGVTGKSTSQAEKFFNTWSLTGSGPGVQVYSKGHTDGAVSFNVASEKLINDKSYPIACETDTENYHALVRTLGIKDWLKRAASAGEGEISKLTKIDKPTYNSQVVIKFDGAGNFTYNQPFGTAFAGVATSYQMDESVSIGFVRVADPAPKVVMLPDQKKASFSGGGAPARAGNEVSPGAKSRLDQLQIEQLLRNLQVNPLLGR